jgi:hypothetical protein
MFLSFQRDQVVNLPATLLPECFVDDKAHLMILYVVRSHLMTAFSTFFIDHTAPKLRNEEVSESCLMRFPGSIYLLPTCRQAREMKTIFFGKGKVWKTRDETERNQNAGASSRENEKSLRRIVK